MNEVHESLFDIVRHIAAMKLFTVGESEVTVSALAAGLLALMFTKVAVWALDRAVGRALARRGVEKHGSSEATRRLLRYAAWAVGLGFALEIAGINIATFFAAGAIFAVGIGFAMQNIAQNFVSGVILLVERSIKPEDVLEVEGRVVRVVAMGIRATVARTRDGEELLVPNAVLVQSTVKNYTMSDSTFRVKASVGVAYDSDLRKVRDALERTAQNLPWRLLTQEPRVLLAAFGSSSVDFEVSVWVDDPWRARERVSDLHEAMWWALKDAGITIAFPQVDVHFDAPVVEALAGPRLRALEATG